MKTFVNKDEYDCRQLDKYSKFLLNAERTLTKISIVPIIGTVSGIVKIAMGTLQTVICSIAWLIFKFPAKDNENALKIFEVSQIYVFHGLGNIVAGLVEAIPFVGLISAQCIRNKIEVRNRDDQEDKFIPYPQISDSPNVN